MLEKGDWMDIRALVEKGMYQKDIAEQLGVHPRTVRRALQRGGMASRLREVPRSKSCLSIILAQTKMRAAWPKQGSHKDYRGTTRGEDGKCRDP